MKRRIVEVDKKEEKAPYLTKRILVSASKTGVKKASAETMELMGYNIIAQDGWVVKKFASGKIERISKLDPIANDAIKLD